MKKIVTLATMIALASCVKKSNLKPTTTESYHVTISATDSTQTLLHGKITIGNSVLNIRKGFKNSILLDTIITDNVSLGLTYGVYLSKVNNNCTTNIDTLNNVSISIVSNSFSHFNSGKYLTY